MSVTCKCFISSGAIVRVNATFGQGFGPILLDNLQCTGLENQLFDCSHGGIEVVGGCTHSLDAGVTCIAGNQFPPSVDCHFHLTCVCILSLNLGVCYHSCCSHHNNSFACTGCHSGEVRLVGGTRYIEGRVEICLNNEWGTVCNQMWDNADAKVVCRQLHFASSGAVALSVASFGDGGRRIWLSNVRCLGTERYLSNCTANSGANSCSHSQDAGVRCQYGKQYCI